MQRKEIKIEKEALNLIIKASDGSVRDSLSILDQANIFKSGDKIKASEIINMLGFAKQRPI